MENTFSIPVPNFSFSSYIERKANDYITNNLGRVPFHAKKEIPDIESALYNFNKSSDRIQFISALIKHIAIKTKEHIDVCKIPNCQVENYSQDILFFLYRKLEEDDIQVEGNTFTADEIYHNSQTIIKIIYALDEIKAGQEIIFNEVDSRLIDNVKADFEDADKLQVLGKKRWFKFVGGIILEYASNKILDVVFKSQILPLLVEIGVSKSLSN